MRIVDDPIAVALAYVLQKRAYCVEHSNHLIFDLGGGNLEVSLLKIKNNCCYVAATTGDTHLEGVDFDKSPHFLQQNN